jgi:hypothetical protein
MPTPSLDALKARLPDYLQSLGLEPRLRGRQLSCRCPLHADSKPSFTATRKDGVWLWHCFPCAKGGTIIDLHAALLSTDAASAIRDLIQRYEAPLFAPPLRPVLPPEKQEHEGQPMPWPVLHHGKEPDLAELAALRGLPVEAAWAAQTLKFLRFTVHHGTPCYALTDGGQRFLQLRRMDGQPFRTANGSVKAWNWPGSKMIPLGARYPGEKQPVLMAEGAVSILELLALLHLSHEMQDSWRWGLLAMPGASAPISVDLLPKLQGRHVRIISDADPAGQKARDRWTSQLQAVGCQVRHVDLSLLPELAAIPRPDLGDLLKLPFSEQKQEILNTIIQ